VFSIAIEYLEVLAPKRSSITLRATIRQLAIFQH